MSERSLSRLFQSLMQISFLQYLKTLRMVKAIEMIVRTNKSISEISFDTGYSSVGSFSNAFYEFTRVRPTAFRRH
ncbi:MAG: transcriptional regulator, AraC family [Flavipsychrobacter sp.]|nr:transcriptional regulator, AraC family [Flavipsychrobacter sp.]